MAHLKNFGVGNFRAFKDKYNFEFAPITILTGTNSSGKSSLTKAILLNKKSFKQSDGIPHLDEIIFDTGLQLGNFDTVINNNDKYGNLIFEVPCRFTARSLSTIRLFYTSGKKQIKNGNLLKLEIYNNDDKNIFFTYNLEGDEAGIKVKFDILYEMALFDSNLRREYFSAKSDLSELMSNLGIKEIDKKNLANYPEKIIELYKTKERLNFIICMDGEYETRLSHSPIYYLMQSHFEKSLPLFDYHAIINVTSSDLSKKLYELYENKHYLSYEDYQASCNIKLAEMKEDAQNAGQHLVDFLIKRELEILNNLLFKTSSSSPFPEDWENDFYNCLRDFLYFLKGNESEVGTTLSSSNYWHVEYDIYDKQADKYTPLNFNDNADFLQNLVKVKLGYDLVDRNKISYSRKEFLIQNEDRYIHSNSINLFNRYLANNLEHAFKTLDRIFKDIDFIPSVRGDIDRRYRIGDNQSELKKLLNYFFATISSNNKSLPFIDKYISEFGIADKVEFLISEDSYDSRIVLYKNGNKFDLADVGYGYSQLVPIILKIALQIEKNSSFEFGISSSILIIEEPETNLHPALQSKLADMFIECYQKYNIQLIIETHSEYLIRRLQRRTAEYYNDKKKNELAISTDFTQIYYFYPPDNVPEGEKQIYPINIENDGALTRNFGRGFYDEAGNEDLLLYQIAKHNKN